MYTKENSIAIFLVEGGSFMSKSEDTKQLILDTAKREFLEKGYNAASVRTIAKKAGLTTGAIFRYYADKAALFEALVSEAADGLVEQFKAAQEAHFELIPKDRTAQSRDLSTEYLRHFVNYVYDRFDEFKLVLCCAEGTKYANYIHDLVELDVERTETYYRLLREKGKIKGSISYELHHMITSAYFTAVFETVVHDMPKKQAMGYVEEIAVFFNSGWEGLLKLV